MAVTIHSEPQAYSPSDNPLTFVFSSDQTAQANFYFIVRIFVAGNLVSEHQIFPEVGARAHFDASERISQYVDSANIQTAFEQSAGNFTEYYITVQEYYGTPAAPQATGTSTTLVAFKACLPNIEWESWDYTDYDVSSLNSTFLTQFPTGQQYLCRDDEDVFLQVISQELSVTVEVELFDIDGVSIVSDTSGAITSAHIHQFNAGIGAIVTEFAGISSSDFDNCYYYTFTVDYTGINTTMTIYRDTADTYEHTPIRFYFLSRIGSIEAFTFGLLNKINGSITSESYARQYGGWNGTDYVYNATTGRTIAYTTNTVERLEANTDWIDENVQQWLVSNMYSSPLVIMNDGTTQQRVVVKTNGYLKKTHLNDGIINEQISVELSNYTKSPLL